MNALGNQPERLVISGIAIILTWIAASYLGARVYLRKTELYLVSKKQKIITIILAFLSPVIIALIFAIKSFFE